MFRGGLESTQACSAHGKSPLQLYVSGILQNANIRQHGNNDLFFEPFADDVSNIENLGVDWEEPVPEYEEDEQVISSADCPITAAQLTLSQGEV